MIPWVLLARAQVPGGGEDLCLFQRGRDFAIRVGLVQLMNSEGHGSEEALASLAFSRRAREMENAQKNAEKYAGKPGVRVLVGGLGMGFTAAAALRELDADGQVIVAELVPAVVDWNRGPLAHLAGNPLSDARVQVHVGDVAELMSSTVAYDLILLDVDNGPHGLTSSRNDRLYSAAGLRRAFAALRQNGVLAVWSSGPDAAFTRRLHAAGFHADLVQARANGRKGWRQWIWLASRAETAPVAATAGRRRMTAR